VAWEVTTAIDGNLSKLVMVKRLRKTDGFYSIVMKLPSADTAVLVGHWFGFSCRQQGSLQTAALSVLLVVHTAVMAMEQRTRTKA
jgi:hypothetical protein